MENRRGFLKTLGKLGAALGLTTVAACSAHHHGHHGGHNPPHHPKHPPKAKGHTARKAPIQVAVKSETVTFGGFKQYVTKNKMRDIPKADPVSQAQAAIDALTNARIDNARMAHNIAPMPSMMVLPPAAYDFMQQKAALRRMDPLFWYEVFDLEWHDWRTDDPAYATVCGWWTATVKRPFKDVFPNETYAKKQQIAMQYLVSRVPDPARVKDMAKEQCHQSLVDYLQRVIRTYLKENPPTPKTMDGSPRSATNLHGITD